MRSLNWGVIGPGKIAHYFANDIELLSPKQKITAVMSDQVDSLNDFANEFNIEQRFLNMDDFVKKSNVDIAYIATPHPFHYEAIKACLENKIAILCEKPIVINLEQFKEIAQLSRKNGTFLMEGMWIRFLPHIKKVVELMSENRIGKICSLRTSMSFKAPCDEDNRYYDPEKGGGSLLDLGVYCVFLSILILGKPSLVKAVGNLSEKNIDEASAILLSHDDGTYSILESSLLIKHNGAAEIFGTDGVIRLLDPWFEKSKGIEIEMDDGKKELISLKWEGHGLQFEIEEAVRSVSEKKIENELMPHALSKTILETMDEIRDQIGVSYPEYE